MSSFIKEFREFVSRGNVMDMAVGIIIGGAFTNIVTSLCTNIINPLISFISGGGAEVTGLVVPEPLSTSVPSSLLSSTSSSSLSSSSAWSRP